MTQIVDAANQTPTSPLLTDKNRLRSVLALTLVCVFGVFIAWLLRQEWAKPELWPWALLIAVMVAGALLLRRLDAWLPGELMPPRIVDSPAKMRRVVGLLCIVAGLALTGLVAWKLWPDYRLWNGTVPLWLAALALVLIGSWLVGSVGLASARAATAMSIWANTRRSRYIEAVAFILILALAIFLRTYRLDSIPSGIYVDESNGSLDALRILEGGGVSPFATGWYETPNGYIYYMAAIYQLFGANWLSLKLVSLLPAILTIPAVYLLGRLLFGPSAGLFAMLFMAVSRWHLSMSRWGWNETAPPLFQVLAFYFLVRGLRDRRALDYTLSGLIAGLAVYTYLSSRLAAATLLLYAAYWFVSDPAGLRTSLRRSALGLILMGVAALIAIGPIMVTYITDPFILNNRVSEISIFRDVSDQGSITPLASNIVDILRFFHQTGDHQGKHNLPDEPMADPVTGLLFAIGFAYAIFAWRDHRRVLLLLWLVIGLAGSYLSSQHESPQSYRSLTALPAVVLMAGDVLDRIVRALYRALREIRLTSSNHSIPVVVASGVAVIALGGATLWESSVYFGPQAESVEVIRGFNPTENQVAHETIAAIEADNTVYLSPNFSDFSPLRFLLYGVIKARTGENTIDNRPYHVVLPEVNLPLPDDGHDVLMLLDSEYWDLRNYVASFYPESQMTLVRLPDGSPIYMKVEITQEQIAALHGLTERLVYADGHEEEQRVSQIELHEADEDIVEASWEGAIRLEHGGEYDLVGEGGLDIYVDGRRWTGASYLGRGLYGLRVVQQEGATGEARLLWRQPEAELSPVPREVLFHFSWPQQGLVGAYYNNNNWEGSPVFRQVAPFLLLAWPDETPIVQRHEFSIRFTGALRVTEPSTYWIRVDADDGARLTLDGEVLAEALIPNQPNNFEVTIDLDRGDHPIEIEYFQNGGGSALRVYWRHGEALYSPIPPAALIPDEAS